MVKKEKFQISNDPNNKNWSTNTTNFGYKMLLKMGWTEGKGLGINEQGSINYVKTTKPIEKREIMFCYQTGIGADFNTVNNWHENRDGFNEILNRLNTVYSKQNIPKETEEDESSEISNKSSSSESEKNEEETMKSPQKVKPRHLIYDKRHRAKLMSTASKTDMAQILGEVPEIFQSYPLYNTNEEKQCKLEQKEKKFKKRKVEEEQLSKEEKKSKKRKSESEETVTSNSDNEKIMKQRKDKKSKKEKKKKKSERE